MQLNEPEPEKYVPDRKVKQTKNATKQIGLKNTREKWKINLCIQNALSEPVILV